MASQVLLQVTTLLIVVQCSKSVIIQPRSAWQAEEPNALIRVQNNLEYVIIHHHSDEQNGCSDSASYELPSLTMLNNAKELIAQAVSGGHVNSNYTLLGHRQTHNELYNEIKTWPYWKSI